MRRHEQRSDRGFTLIELLVVVTIIPLIVGAISVALIAVFKNETSVSRSLSGSGDAQVVSANFVADVQTAQWVTTDPGPPASGPATVCGTGTQVLTLSADNTPTSAGIVNVISYVEVPSGSTTSNLVRNVCHAGTQTSTSVVSRDVPRGLQPTFNPATMGTSALAGWVASQGTQSITLSLVEPPTNYAYTLAATPRAVAPPLTGPGSSVTPTVPLPFELLGASASCPPNPPDLSIGGTSTFEVGPSPSFNGAMGIASTCAGSVSMPRSGTLKATIDTANPGLNSVSGGGGAQFPTSETYDSSVSNPYAGLVSPSASASGLGAGSCTETITSPPTYTCSTGIYATTPNLPNTAVITFDPSTGPDPNVFVFDQAWTIHNSQQVTFEGGATVSQVTYWFRGGLTTSGASNTTFGPATYIYGDIAANQSAVTTLGIGNGSVVSSNQDQGVLFYVVNGLASFSGSTSTPIEGTAQYDDVAIWDASSYPITLNGSSTIANPLGGIYDSSPNCNDGGTPPTAVACVQFTGSTGLVTDSLVAYSVSAPSGSALIQILGN